MNITPEKAHLGAFLSGDGTAGHSKGNWTTKHEVIYSGNNLFISRPDYSTMGVMPSERLSNCNLMALAQHAPHDCGDPECPGVVNKRKLELYDKFQTAINEFAKAGLLT